MLKFVPSFVAFISILPLALAAVQVSTPLSLSAGQFSSISSHNGQTFAAGVTASGVGVIYSLNVNSQFSTIIAGSVSTSFQDGIGTSAGIYAPLALVIDPRPNSDALYFVDQKPAAGAYAIRKLVISTATVTSVVGNFKTCTVPSMVDPINGPANQTTACALTGITMDNNGNVYYLDYNILRVFHADLGTVTTLVGTYNGNPSNPQQYVDSPTGASAYMASPTALALAENGAGVWILDTAAGGSIHYINISNPSYPMVTPHTNSATGAATSSTWVRLCTSEMSASAIYLISTCSASASGQVMSLDLNSLAVSTVAGSGSCQLLDGQGLSASFAQPSACTSASASSTGETLLVVDIASTNSQTGVIREVVIGNAPTIPPSSTTPAPGGHSSAVERSSTLSTVLVSTIVSLISATVYFVFM